MVLLKIPRNPCSEACVQCDIAQILAVRTEFPRCNFVVTRKPLEEARQEIEHDDSNKYGSCRSLGCVSFGADDYGEARHIGSRSEERCCGAEEARSVERARHVHAADGTAAGDKAAPADGYYVQSSGCDEGSATPRTFRASSCKFSSRP